jgi:hypothetical protein
MQYFKSLVCLAVFAASPAFAQDSDELDWKITPYLWGVNVDGTIGVGPINQDIDAGFSDIVSDVDVGGSIYAELGKGSHAIHADYTYLRLKPDATQFQSSPFPPGSELKTKMTINMFETGYNYRMDGLWYWARVIPAST